MARSWNTTGLYKASRDQMPAKRSRRIKASPPAAKLVMPREDCPLCQQCGEREDSTFHFIQCIEQP